MIMKTVLLPMENHDGMQSVLETAVLLARRHDSYIEGFALRWTIENVAGVDAFAAEQYERVLAAEAQRARQTFESFMQKSDVPRSSKGMTSLSFGWLNEPLKGESVVGTYGRAFDVIVMNRPSADSPGLYRRAVESGLFESGRPMLLSPPTPPQHIGTNVLIAWNGSTEQARTMALSMPLLERAERVTVLTVTGGTEVPGPSAKQMIRYLQLKGVRSQRLTVELGEKKYRRVCSGHGSKTQLRSLDQGCVYAESIEANDIRWRNPAHYGERNPTCPACALRKYV
jgi:hypothetical protein